MVMPLKLKRFDDFTHIFLVYASQMAYIEEAHATHAILQKFSELYRYLIKNDDTSMLKDELNALLNYLDIQKNRNQNRFDIVLDNKMKNMDNYIKRLSLLDFADNIMESALMRYESHFNIRLELKNDGNPGLTAFLETDDTNEIFDMTLMEEGK